LGGLSKRDKIIGSDYELETKQSKQGKRKRARKKKGKRMLHYNKTEPSIGILRLLKKRCHEKRSKVPNNA